MKLISDIGPRVKAVKALENFVIQLHFDNGEIRKFDCKPFINKGFFKELSSVAYFKRVTVSGGSVVWPNGQDFCPDVLFRDSVGVL